MVAFNANLHKFEELVAELTSAAYSVALRHGIGGSFLEVELELWRELRAVFARVPSGRTAVDNEAKRAHCLAQAAQEVF